MVVGGSIRVQLCTQGGREVLLYRVGAGDTCILTTACLLGGTHYAAEGIAETEVRAFVIPAAGFSRVLDSDAHFRQLVFAHLGQRLAQVMRRIEQIAFGPIDVRLAGILLELTRDGPRLALTHQALAAELGTAREVVSRHLKRFEGKGWVRLGRGIIEVTERGPLQRFGSM